MNIIAPIVFLTLCGCTADYAAREASLAVQGKGCFCSAKQCEEVISATGQAAIEAAGSQVHRRATIEQRR